MLGLAASAADNRERALQSARRAVEIDPDDALAHCAMGKARVLRKEHALAVPDLGLAIELNPSLAWAHYGLGAATVFAGQAAPAIGHLEDAIRLSPRDQHMGSFLVRLAEAYLLLKDYTRAVERARQALQQQGFQWSRYAALLAALGYQGHREEADGRSPSAWPRAPISPSPWCATATSTRTARRSSTIWRACVWPGYRISRHCCKALLGIQPPPFQQRFDGRLHRFDRDRRHDVAAVVLGPDHGAA